MNNIQYFINFAISRKNTHIQCLEKLIWLKFSGAVIASEPENYEIDARITAEINAANKWDSSITRLLGAVGKEEIFPWEN